MTSDILVKVENGVVDLKTTILNVFEEDVPMRPSHVRALEKLLRACDDYLEG